MKTWLGDVQVVKSFAPPSKRARLDALLFNGAKLGAPLLALAAFVGPKLPPLQGE